VRSGSWTGARANGTAETRAAMRNHQPRGVLGRVAPVRCLKVQTFSGKAARGADLRPRSPHCFHDAFPASGAAPFYLGSCRRRLATVRRCDGGERVNLLGLIARERTRRAENPDTGALAGITDADRVKALEAFLTRVRSGKLSADDEERPRARDRPTPQGLH